MSDHIAVDTDAVAKDGSEMNALADYVRELKSRFSSSADALGRPWGEGDAIADSFKENYLPARYGVERFFTALADAFQDTAESTVETAKRLAGADDYGKGLSDRLIGHMGGDGPTRRR
ncbi:hypothetical protein [Nocardiopsis composta]|uniref:Uncharacterized protein YukE n=1 Tax=Nocardiopsis composta TaxID=157465 RepID=A0A7W8QQP8_9ACTN|nr:hypothetical protein [Nocardiopsis composta]MBB5434163.1 uncharacterized protein YukE [Nocardiopsis composta]